MHDIKGRLVEEGATIKFKGWDPYQQKSRSYVGVISGIFPNSDSCNAMVTRPVFGGTVSEHVTLKDVELLLNADGSEPAAPVETAFYEDGSSATGPGPLPDVSPTGSPRVGG